MWEVRIDSRNQWVLLWFGLHLSPHEKPWGWGWERKNIIEMNKNSTTSSARWCVKCFTQSISFNPLLKSCEVRMMIYIHLIRWGNWHVMHSGAHSQFLGKPGFEPGMSEPEAWTLNHRALFISRFQSLFEPDMKVYTMSPCIWGFRNSLIYDNRNQDNNYLLEVESKEDWLGREMWEALGLWKYSVSWSGW